MAALVGVGDDTLRRWVEADGIATSTDDSGRTTVSGRDVAAYAARTEAPTDHSRVLRSARNRFVAHVTAITSDTVMAQSTCSAVRFTWYRSRAPRRCGELGLEVGSVATAVVKATTVIVETTSSGSR